MFQVRVRLTPSNKAYRQFATRNQVWTNYSWADTGARVLRWRAALRAEALTSGARIAVLVPNGIEHVCIDQAALALGCVPVPVIADTLAAIVYTSGTTGRPKRIMLSHRNVISNVNAIMAVMQVRENDAFLSFLPLSHTFERTVGYYLPIAAGASVAFARSIPLLMEDLIAIRPTILVSVPRIYERACAALRESVDRHMITRQLFAMSVKMGWRRFEHSQGRASRPSILMQWVYPLLDRLIATRVRARFGGRLRAAVTGGAAMASEISKPLLALGVPILQGYG